LIILILKSFIPKNYGNFKHIIKLLVHFLELFNRNRFYFMVVSKIISGIYEQFYEILSYNTQNVSFEDITQAAS